MSDGLTSAEVLTAPRVRASSWCDSLSAAYTLLKKVCTFTVFRLAFQDLGVSHS